MNYLKKWELHWPPWYVLALGAAAALVLVLAVVFPTQAWDCRRYNFRVTSGGDVQVENRSSSDEPAQRAEVFFNGKSGGTVDVPAMKAGTSWTTFLNVVPPTGDWTWRVVGSKDCEDSGKHEGDDPTRTPHPPTETPEKPTHTPDPTVTPKRPTHTPDPTATDTPDIPTDTPEPSETPVTPTHTVEPTDTPEDTPPPPTATKPPPTDPPHYTDTPIPPTKPPPVKTKTPIPPTQTATPRGGTPTPSDTPTPTPTVGCACYLYPPDDPDGMKEVWSYIHLDDDAIAGIASAIETGNERSNKYIEQHGELIRAKTDDLIEAVDNQTAVLREIRQALWLLGLAILGGGGAWGLLYYGISRKRPGG